MTENLAKQERVALQAQGGTVGPPMPCLEFRLEGVPEMNYDATGSPPRGEVCLRGASLFSGYYKQEDKTAEVVDAEGWFHTGTPRAQQQANCNAPAEADVTATFNIFLDSWGAGHSIVEIVLLTRARGLTGTAGTELIILRPSTFADATQETWVRSRRWAP